MNQVRLLFPGDHGTTSAIKQVSVNLFTFHAILWNIKEVVYVMVFCRYTLFLRYC